MSCYVNIFHMYCSENFYQMLYVHKESIMCVCVCMCLCQNSSLFV